MAGRETADIVFCIDASGSMTPTIDGVKKNVEKLVEALDTSGLQRKWDVRVDFLAYSNSRSLMRIDSTECRGAELLESIYHRSPNGQTSSKLFTRDINLFKKKLNEIRCTGDESNLLALDIAADYPFRDASTCHRVIVLLTDEAVSTGVYEEETAMKVMNLAMKLQDKKIMLFMVTPDCPVFDKLSQVDKCEWTVDESNGLENIDFKKLLESIGKSVSVSQSNGAGRDDPMPLFCESTWKKEAFDDDGEVYVKVEGIDRTFGVQ